MNNIKKAAVWHILAKVIQRVINPLLILLVAGTLTTNDFASFTFVLASANAIASIVHSPIENLGRVGLAQKNGWGIKVWLGIFSLMVFVFYTFGVGLGVINLSFDEHSGSFWLELTFLSFAFSLWAGIMAFLNGFRLYSLQTMISISLFVMVMGFGLSIYFGFVLFDFIYVLIVSYFMAAFFFLYHLFTIKVQLDKVIKIDWKFLISIVVPSFVGSAFVGVVLLDVQNFFYSFGPDELSVFNVLNQLKGVVLFIPVAIQSIVLPHLYAHYIHKDAMIIHRSNFFISLGLVFISAIMLLLLNDSIAALYNLSQDVMSEQIVLFVILVILTGISAPVGSMLIIKYGIWANMLLNIFFGVFYIVMTQLFVPTNSHDILLILNTSYFVLFILSFLFARDRLIKTISV